MKSSLLVALALLACNQDYDKFVFPTGGAAATGGGAQGGGGAGGSPPASAAVACGADACDNCCVAETDGTSPACADICAPNQAAITCDGASDCDGQLCCLAFAATGELARAECKSTCANGEDELCDAGDASPCQAGSCSALSELPGFDACQ